MEFFTSEALSLFKPPGPAHVHAHVRLRFSPPWAGRRWLAVANRAANPHLPPAAHLCNGPFHRHLQDVFVPLVVRYIDLMESSIAQSVHRGFQQETWQPVK